MLTGFETVFIFIPQLFLLFFFKKKNPPFPYSIKKKNFLPLIYFTSIFIRIRYISCQSFESLVETQFFEIFKKKLKEKEKCKERRMGDVIIYKIQFERFFFFEK